MDFKSFLTEKFLNEEDWDKEAFIRASYRQVFPDGHAKTSDSMWSAILKKSQYKLTKRSREKTKTSVNAAKGVVTAAKAHIGDGFDRSDFAGIEDTSLADSLSQLTPEEFEQLKGIVPALQELNSPEELVQNLDNLDAETMQAVQDALTPAEPEAQEQSETPAEQEVSDVPAEQEQPEVQEEPEQQETQDEQLPVEQPEDIPAEQEQPEVQEEPEQQEVPEQQSHTDSLNAIMQSQHMEELNKSMETYGIEANEDGTPNFDDPEAVDKIFKAVSNGDNTLYDEYILTYGNESSPLVKKLKSDLEKEYEVKMKTLEQREDRYKAMTDGIAAASGFALFLDVFMSVFSGDETNVFSEIAKKNAFAKTAREVFNNSVDNKLVKSDAEAKHAQELDTIENDFNARLEKLKKTKKDPSDSPVFKKKYMELTREFNETLNSHNERVQEINALVNKKSKIDKIIFAITNGTIDQEELQTLIPRKENETDEDYSRRLNDVKGMTKTLKEQSSAMQKEVEGFNNEISGIIKDYNAKTKALNKDPDVLNDIQAAKDSYKLKKQRLEAERDLLIAKENERHSKYAALIDSLEERRKKAAKNISVMCAWSSDPEKTLAQELANYNKECLERAGAAGIELPPEEYPVYPDDVMAYLEKDDDDGFGSNRYSSKGRSKGKSKSKSRSSAKSGRSFDIDDFDFDDDDDDLLLSYGGSGRSGSKGNKKKSKGIVPVTDEEKALVPKIKNEDLKALWTELANKGISAMSIEGFSDNLKDEDKILLIQNFMKANPQIFGIKESVRKKAFRELNKGLKAGKRIDERAKTRKFSELFSKKE